MYYAQITNGKVVAVTETSGAISAPHMVAIASLNTELLGQSYSNGVFTALNTGRRYDITSRLAEIDAAGDKARTRREMLLAKAGTKVWLQVLDDEAVTLRAELAGLP